MILPPSSFILLSPMIITIDGPAGTGKSSVSQEVARRLGLGFLDTGAMYRAIALAAIRRGIRLDDADALGTLAESVKVDFDWSVTPPRVRLDGQDVADQIRSEQVSSGASKVAVVPRVRSAMVKLQQDVGRTRPQLVTEGRDQGTVVFPDAELKIYLDATPEERAKRRKLQLDARGEKADYTQLLQQIRERDARDSGRSVGPLSAAADARRIDTTNLTQQQVVDAITTLAQQVQKKA
jgi:CMP/dCMP kinase